MLLQSSGSKYQSFSYRFPLADASQVGTVRRFAAQLCAQTDFDEVRVGRVNIIINELGNNLVKYAQDGVLILRLDRTGETDFLEILSVDRGPGIEDVENMLRDGVTTGTTPGTGLGAVQRLSEHFDIYSQPGRGTVTVAQVTAQDSPRPTVVPAVICSGISIPLQGEDVCGDGWALRLEGRRFTLLGVDGLGHGPAAHAAAQEAIACFTAAEVTDLSTLMERIHGRLKSTRGAAVFLLSGEADGLVESTGVGNFRGLLQTGERHKGLISQNGTAGVQVRRAQVQSLPWDGNGVFVLHSDGLSSRWDLGEYPGLQLCHPAIIAGVAFRDFNRQSDDATVVVLKAVR